MRNGLRRREMIFVWALAAVIAAPRPAEALQRTDGMAADSLAAWIWVDRGEEPVVAPGEEVRVYYRVSSDAYVAIFRVDTEGRVSMIFPQHPAADSWTIGGRDNRLLLAESRTWDVADLPGEGAFFLVASRDPFDFSLLDFDDVRGWDLSAAGAEAYDDTYQAIDDHVLAILPAWENAEYALDLLPYEVVDEVALGRPSDVVVLRSGRRVTYVPPVRRVEYVSVSSGPHIRLFIRFGPLPRARVRVYYGPPPVWRRIYWAPPPPPAPYPRYVTAGPRRGPPRYAPPRQAPPRYAPPSRPGRPERPVRPSPPRRPTVTRPAQAPPSRPVVTRRAGSPASPGPAARPARDGGSGRGARPARGGGAERGARPARDGGPGGGARPSGRSAPGRGSPSAGRPGTASGRAAPARATPSRPQAARRPARRGGSGSSPHG